jgi:O-antigen ligase
LPLTKLELAEVLTVPRLRWVAVSDPRLVALASAIPGDELYSTIRLILFVELCGIAVGISVSVSTARQTVACLTRRIWTQKPGAVSKSALVRMILILTHTNPTGKIARAVAGTVDLLVRDRVQLERAEAILAFFAAVAYVALTNTRERIALTATSLYVAGGLPRGIRRVRRPQRDQAWRQGTPKTVSQYIVERPWFVGPSRLRAC